jgi:hypothetical protein
LHDKLEELTLSEGVVSVLERLRLLEITGYDDDVDEQLTGALPKLMLVFCFCKRCSSSIRANKALAL